MKPIYEAGVIQIEVTNNCDHMCANCTRFIGHHKKTYFMDLETIEKAIDSLEGYPGMIGCMGGEPSLHPQFADILKLFQEKIPDKNRRGLWTDGFNWKKYDSLIRETFPIGNIVYNDHQSDDKGYHQQLLIASDEIIEDKELMWELIDNCWVQKRWSPSINPKGCFSVKLQPQWTCYSMAQVDGQLRKDGGKRHQRILNSKSRLRDTVQNAVQQFLWILQAVIQTLILYLQAMPSF